MDIRYSCMNWTRKCASIKRERCIRVIAGHFTGALCINRRMESIFSTAKWYPDSPLGDTYIFNHLKHQMNRWTHHFTFCQGDQFEYQQNMLRQWLEIIQIFMSIYYFQSHLIPVFSSLSFAIELSFIHLVCVWSQQNVSIIVKYPSLDCATHFCVYKILFYFAIISQIISILLIIHVRRMTNSCCPIKRAENKKMQVDKENCMYRKERRERKKPHIMDDIALYGNFVFVLNFTSFGLYWMPKSALIWQYVLLRASSCSLTICAHSFWSFYSLFLSLLLLLFYSLWPYYTFVSTNEKLEFLTNFPETNDSNNWIFKWNAFTWWLSARSFSFSIFLARGINYAADTHTFHSPSSFLYPFHLISISFVVISFVVSSLVCILLSPSLFGF